METKDLDSLLAPYNPWWDPDSRWETLLPDFQRPVVDEVLADLKELPQGISITGPRRVGTRRETKFVDDVLFVPLRYFLLAT